MKRTRIGLVVALMPLAACTTLSVQTHSIVEYSEDAANVFVAAYPPVPWSEIADRLEPKRNLTVDQARTLANQTTQFQVSQFISHLSIALGLGLPTSASTTSTSLKADGTQETTGTKTKASGSVPTSSGVNDTNIGETALAPNLAQGSLAVPMDGAGQIMAETGIYQLAHILDNHITKAFYPRGYQAHLITLQVNLQPKKRDLPYDAYIDIVLMPASWEDTIKSSVVHEKASSQLPPVIVYPLVITDAMETASVGRSVETLRQAALSLSGTVGGAGVNLGAAGGTDKLDSVIGADRNSIVTVGRVSDHTVRMRLGAVNQGSYGLTMVPRTHNVSMVVFTRWDTDVHLERLAITTHVDVYPVAGGDRLKSGRLRKELADRVDVAVKNYGFAIDTRCDELVTGDAINARLDLLRALESGDYRHVQTCLGLTRVSPGQEVRLRRLLPALMSLEADSRYSKMTVQLKPLPDTKLPSKEQLVLLGDDGEGVTSIVLRGAAAIEPSALSASLNLKGANRQPIVLYPTTLSVARSGTEIQLSFPSLKVLGFTASDLIDEPLQLKYAANHSPAQQEAYRVRALADGAKPTPNPVSTTSSVIVADDTGTAKLMLRIGNVDSNNLPVLAVTGADVREAAPASIASVSQRGVSVLSTGIFTMTLANLTPAQPVTIRTIDGAKGIEIGNSIRLGVERIVGARQ